MCLLIDFSGASFGDWWDSCLFVRVSVLVWWH